MAKNITTYSTSFINRYKERNAIFSVLNLRCNLTSAEAGMGRQPLTHTPGENVKWQSILIS